MKRAAKWCVLIFLVFSIAGCATNRGYLNVQVDSASLVTPNGKQIYIRSIADNRQFEDKPASADIPSLGFGGVANATIEMKSRAIARKRNGYGKAMGDIMLDEGQSVQKIVYAATRNALYSLGYEVVDKQEDAKADAIIIDISIDKFWGWINMGFWAIPMKSEITTTNTVTIPSNSNPIIVRAAITNNCQVANEANWKKAFKLVINDFTEKAKVEFKKLDAKP
jgi:hypothetical protein